MLEPYLTINSALITGILLEIIIWFYLLKGEKIMEKEKHNLIIKGIKKSWNDEDLNRYIEEIRQEARKELIEEVKKIIKNNFYTKKGFVVLSVDRLVQLEEELNKLKEKK